MTITMVTFGSTVGCLYIVIDIGSSANIIASVITACKDVTTVAAGIKVVRIA